MIRRACAAALVVGAAACGTDADPSAPTTTSATATVPFVYRAPTTPRADLPASARECVQGVGRTHIHPGWRSFARIEMTPVGGDRWEIATDSKGNLYTTETWEGKRLQKFVFKGTGRVRAPHQGVVWPGTR